MARCQHLTVLPPFDGEVETRCDKFKSHCRDIEAGRDRRLHCRYELTALCRDLAGALEDACHYPDCGICSLCEASECERGRLLDQYHEAFPEGDPNAE